MGGLSSGAKFDDECNFSDIGRHDFMGNFGGICHLAPL
jgi:hypothetical protein